MEPAVQQRDPRVVNRHHPAQSQAGDVNAAVPDRQPLAGDRRIRIEREIKRRCDEKLLIRKIKSRTSELDLHIAEIRAVLEDVDDG
jgi:hypothetical protein